MSTISRKICNCTGKITEMLSSNAWIVYDISNSKFCETDIVQRLLEQFRNIFALNYLNTVHCQCPLVTVGRFRELWSKWIVQFARYLEQGSRERGKTRNIWGLTVTPSDLTPFVHLIKCAFWSDSWRHGKELTKITGKFWSSSLNLLTKLAHN